MRVRLVVLCLLAALSPACRKAAEQPEPSSQPQPAVAANAAPLAAPEATADAGALPSSLRERIDHYKRLINLGDYPDGIAAIRETLPDLEHFVEKNPTVAEGQIQLAGAYTAWMFIAAGKLPSGQEATRALVEATDRDYVGRAVRALDAFDRYSDPNDRRRAAAAEIRRMLDDIRTRASCPEDFLRLCRKVESGDAPAQVFGTMNVHEMIGKLERCRGCGSFERIESKVLPSARKMRELIEEIQKKK